jgi:hypothetical protein
MPPAAGTCPIELPFISAIVEGHLLQVEVAATPEARSCGLSRRTSLPADQGMLFVYPEPRLLSFWMKDTQIPLSIVFLDEAGRILSIQSMVPMQVGQRYRSPQPACYALEVNQGWFRQHEIEAGDVVRFQLPQVLNIR